MIYCVPFNCKSKWVPISDIFIGQYQYYGQNKPKKIYPPAVTAMMAVCGSMLLNIGISTLEPNIVAARHP